MKKLAFILIVFTSLFGISCVAQNERIRELQTQTTANNGYYFVVDAGGWTRAKKITLGTMTSLEKYLREYQDSLTRYGAGTNTTTGAYATFTTAHYLKSADFAAAHKTRNIHNATYILDSLLYGLRNGLICFSPCLDTIHSTAQVVLDSGITATKGTFTESAVEPSIANCDTVSLVCQSTYISGIGTNIDVTNVSAGNAIDITETGVGVGMLMNNISNGNDTIIVLTTDSTLTTGILMNDMYNGIQINDAINAGIDIKNSLIALSLLNNDYSVYIDNSLKTTSTPIYIQGGTGIENAIEIDGGNGNDIGLKYSGGAGSDIGLSITAETAASLTGDVAIWNGSLVQSSDQPYQDKDSIPDVTSLNVVLFNYPGTLQLRGFQNGVTGQIVYIANQKSANDIVIKNNAVITTIGGAKIITGTGSDVTITGDGGAIFAYSGTYWILISVQQ